MPGVPDVNLDENVEGSPLTKSTLRRTLSCLLESELKLHLMRRPSGKRCKLCMAPADEERLTDWMDDNAFVAWVVCKEPWHVERELLSNAWPSKPGWPRLPLNIRGSCDPFRVELKKLRAAAGKGEVARCT
jgi:hypothetical protein